MSKIGIIIGREYKTRVMKKSFIILTLLTPVLMAVIMLAPTLIMLLGDSSEKNITVIDQTGLYRNVFTDSEQYHFIFADQTPDQIREQMKNSDSPSAALLVITADLAQNPKAATIFSRSQIDMPTKDYIVNILENYTREQKLASYNIPEIQQIIENSKANLDVKTITWSKDGEERMGSAELALILGMVAAILIYMFILIYGSQVMSGVVQEKTSRIVEVIVSSVKPFELMMGKIIGVALVGLTQMFIWAVLAIGLYSIGMSFVPPELMTQSVELTAPMGQQMPVNETNMSFASELLSSIGSVNFLQIGVLLVVYFLGGYLLYASLFAALGSAVDNETETQQFTLPVTLPMILAIYAGIYASQHPESAFAFWTSLIPFTSPVVMMARLPFGVAMWEIALSVALLVLSFFGSTWVAAKIYRTGILMYGKKITWKELWKWLRY